jgi:hypothetical protein
VTERRTDRDLGITGLITWIERNDARADELEELRKALARPLVASDLDASLRPPRSERLRALIAPPDPDETFIEKLRRYRHEKLKP